MWDQGPSKGHSWWPFSFWLMNVHLFTMSLHGRACHQVSLIIRSLIPSWAPHLMILSQPNYQPKVSSLNSITLGIRPSTYNFWGGRWEGGYYLVHSKYQRYQFYLSTVRETFSGLNLRVVPYAYQCKQVHFRTVTWKPQMNFRSIWGTNPKGKGRWLDDC